jgi:MFS family permease
MTDSAHKTRMLVLIGVLHAFTHVYQVALMPLYLPIQKTFGLGSVGSATFLVTLLMFSYFLPSYPMGILADRISRKKLLGAGLAVNAAGFLLLGCAKNYPLALAAVIISGMGGSCFHPPATALIARLFPSNPGRALGLIGIGASVGFFSGPLYAGWRAAHTGNWRAPVLELGVLGLLGSIAFLWLAEDTPTEPHPSPGSNIPKRSVPHAMFGSTQAALLFVGAGICFSLRDFTGSSMGSLGSLFLQSAHQFSVEQTGTALSAIFLASVVSNPLFGHLSDRGRKRWTAFVHLIAAGLILIFPRLPGTPSIIFFIAFMAYGFFFMASYPMVEAAVMLAVHDSVRGRAFGLWITIGGSIGNLSHWLVGRWVDGFGLRATDARTYYGLYAGLAAALLVSLIGLPLLERIRRREVDAEHAPPGGPLRESTSTSAAP